MREVAEVLIPAIAFALVFSVVFTFIGYMRYLRYRETIALAEKGLLRPEKVRRQRDPVHMLRVGTMAMVMGGGVALIFMAALFVTNTEELAVPAILFGCLPALLGLGLTAVYFVTRWASPQTEDSEEEIDPIPPHKAGL